MRTRGLARVLLVVACLALSACPGDDASVGGGDGTTFPVERFAPGASSPLRLASVLAVRGQSTVAGPFYSIDGRQTWHFLPEFPIRGFHWVSDTTGVYDVSAGPRFLDLETGRRVNHTVPAGAPWTVVGETLVVLEQITLSASDPAGPGVRPRLLTVPVDGVGASWTVFDLPVMPEASRTYRPSLHLGEGGTIYVVARYGMFHGEPVPSATWTFHPLVPTGGTIGWSDNPVWVSRSGAIYVSNLVSFDGGASFEPRERSDAPWEHQDEDGTIHLGGQRSTDGGETWTPLIDEALSERLGEFIGPTNDRLRGRLGELHIERGVYTNLVVRADGSVETFVPHVAGSADSRARNVEDLVVLADGSLLGRIDTELVRFRQGDRAWTWLRAVPQNSVIQGLRDGRVVMMTRGASQGQLRFSDDGGETWSEPRAAPNLTRIFELPGQWLGTIRNGCTIGFATTTDEFVSYEQRLALSQVLESSGEPSEPPYEFEPATTTRDGTLHGNAVGFSVGLNGTCTTYVAGPARSVDAGLTAIRDRHDPLFLPRVIASNSRDGLVAAVAEGLGQEFYLRRSARGSWHRAGQPALDGEIVELTDQLFIELTDLRFAPDDHLLLPTFEGLVRSSEAFR